MLLNDMTIRALKAPEKGSIVYPCDTLTGFGVRVSEGGTKSYVLTHGVRRQRETIGRVGIVSLSEARKKAKTILASHQLGIGPQRSISYATALYLFLHEKATRRKNTLSAYERHLAYFKFGETKLNDLTPHDFQKVLDRIKKPAERHKTFVVARVFLNWCYRKHYMDTKPLERMDSPDRSKSRERVLTDDELRKVWHACGEDTFGRIVKLLILTGQRRGEIANLTGAMIGDNSLTFPSWLTKNGKEHTIPLAATARALITIPAQSSGTSICFRARAKTTSFNGFSKSKRALDRTCQISKWTLHDLRRTFASGLQKLGVRSEVIEALLNHTPQGIRAVYQRHDWSEEKREAVELWEAHLKIVLGI